MDRPSPSESATLYKVGTTKIGNDYNKWIVTQNKNGINRWKLYKKTIKKPTKKSTTALDLYNCKTLSHKDFEIIVSKNEKSKYIYEILKTEIIPGINKIGIETFFIPLTLSTNNIYYTDYAPHYILKMDNKNIYKMNYMYFEFYLNMNGDEIILTKPINIHFSTLNKENKIKIINMFDKYLKNYYKWSGSNTDLMIINYQKINKKINKRQIKDDDYYPQLYIKIYSKINFLENNKMIDKLIKYFIDLKTTGTNHYDDYDIEFTLYSIDEKKINKIKKYLDEQPYIKSYKMYLSNRDENNKIIEKKIS